MARLIAKTVVDARLAEECHVAISYVIGKADPVAFHIDTFGTGQYPDWLLTDAAQAIFRCARPRSSNGSAYEPHLREALHLRAHGMP